MGNDKTVDPRNKGSTKVIQLETAMGAAISCFKGATALLIPRTRFAPVKKCDDLIALRSDAYVVTEDFRIELNSERKGVPSLKNCDKLTIKGEVEFAAGVTCIGDVTFSNAGEGKKVVAAGTYENTTVEL